MQDNVRPVSFLPDAYVNENCPHCHAEWGHFIICPLINRNTAEARYALFTPTEEDQLEAHALGVKLEHSEHRL